jgi:hypothetical protein
MAILPVFSHGSTSGKPIEDIFLSIGFFLFGCAGLPMIIRREFPFFNMTLYGVIPVIIGLFFLITSWWFAIHILLEAVPVLFQ